MKRLVQSLKNTFIPHEGNDHRPHLLRPRTVAFVCMVALAVESIFIFSSSYVIPRSRLFGVILVNALMDGTNAARAANRLPALRLNPLLQAAAGEKVNDMAKNNYFAHTSPSGVTPWFWFTDVGYRFAAAGENLAVNFSDSAEVTSAWLNSPAHRENILNAGFTEIGVATAQGQFEGHPAVYVVEVFGTPAVSFALAPATRAAAPAPTPGPAAPPPATNGSETFAAVKGVEVASAPTAPAENAATKAQTSNLVQKAAADPRRTVDYFYFAIAALFAVALLLNIFIKIRIQHAQVILGGMLVILIAGLLIILNQHAAAMRIIIL